MCNVNNNQEALFLKFNLYLEKDPNKFIIYSATAFRGSERYSSMLSA